MLVGSHLLKMVQARDSLQRRIGFRGCKSLLLFGLNLITTHSLSSLWYFVLFGAI